MDAIRARYTSHPLMRGQVTYMHIFEDSHLTLGVFCLPQGATIPLHDHPGMTVVSRLLFGTLQVKSFDYADPMAAAASTATASGTAGSSTSSSASSSSSGGCSAPSCRPAHVVMNSQITAPAEPLVLYPDRGGNIHEFTALTPCAILDILTPPYAPDAGRDCTYFKQRPRSGGPKGSVVDLEVTHVPRDVEPVRGPYLGLPVYLPDS